MIESREKISLQSPYFDGVTGMVDKQLERTVMKMLSTKSTEGVVTLKIKIDFVEADSAGALRAIPQITCDVTGTVQLKEGAKRIAGGAYSGAVIEPDENGEIGIRGSRQTSLFDEKSNNSEG